MASAETKVIQRQQAVTAALTDIRAILAQGELSRVIVDRVAHRLAQLAAQHELFGLEDFPPPSETVETSTRYRLNSEDGDDDLALYLNSLLPGKSTLPHNHTTWAAIAAVEGDELNRIYQRLDDGSQPDRADLQLVREVVVRPGEPLAFLPDDIHSIHVAGERPIRHLHLYGQPLETLVRRVAIDPQTGKVTNYNATQMKPSENRA
ncbi:cysteine dioxygenase family protein [Brenneria tiliae]|uniref:Cysteine dioxygenase family protein n=1 Tax=Brenneria tiliae TaxID=2914984 RepID=A0ABT0MV89_9GAMM|nr:cysteine dioxygenase family protein [Brenneria tiliae]MCL2893775.1 cysteine dioxygenase family protein [Brenneria tiliae]MCL2899088.1 cysteine dioxygenase family protein [Brenneria tiliae]MCL2903466.1 cysteine dioxygenase family protein [Brenneria tiliae]